MTDKIDASANVRNEVADHASQMLIAETFPTTTITVKRDYPTCHSTPHAGDASGGDIKLGGDANANQQQTQTQRQSAEANAAANSHSDSKANSSSNSNATGGDAKATGGNATSNSRGGDVTINQNQNPSAYAESATEPASTFPSSGSSEFSFARGNVKFRQGESTGSDSDNFALNLHFPVSPSLFPVGIGVATGSSRVNEKGEARVQQTHAAGLAAGESMLGAATGDGSLIIDGNAAYTNVVRDAAAKKEK